MDGLMTEVPEQHVSAPLTQVAVPDVSLNPSNFQAEIAKIAAEQGLKIENGNAVPIAAPETIRPVQAAPAPVQQTVTPAQPAQVPEKFQTPDGQVDLQKVQKSTVNAEEALQRYLTLERELRQTQANVNRLQSGQAQQPQPVQQPLQYAPQAPNALPQITPDLINQALERGKNPGQVLFELTQIAQQAAYEQATANAASQIKAINERVEAKERRDQLNEVARTDEWVFTKEGQEILAGVAKSNPWVMGAPNPWQAAYHLYKGQSQQQSTPVQMPNPTAQTAKAPATPVNAGSIVGGPGIAQLSRNPSQLNAMLNGMTKEQETAFWRSTIPGAK